MGSKFYLMEGDLGKLKVKIFVRVKKRRGEFLVFECYWLLMDNGVVIC